MKVQDILLQEKAISVAVEAGKSTLISTGAPQDTDHRITLCLNLGCSSGMITTARYWRRDSLIYVTATLKQNEFILLYLERTVDKIHSTIQEKQYDRKIFFQFVCDSFCLFASFSKVSFI